MRRIWTILLAGVFAAILLAFTMTYTVRFNESAVVTTFGKAGKDDVRRTAGLGLKWPYPVQAVTKYDTRVRVTPVKLETNQTADNRPLIVEAFATWRVEDPLSFFQRFSNAGERAEDHFVEAEKALRDSLRSAMGLISQYRMDELFSAQAGGSKIPELERKVLEAFSLATDRQTGLSLKDYGIVATGVGVSRVVLPESVTSAVFEAMKARREIEVRQTETRGVAEAEAIRQQASQQAGIIKSFAEARAATISALGAQEAAQYLARMNANSELAVFLENMRFIEEAMMRQATLVLPGTLPGMSMMFPNALDNIKEGQVPRLALPEEWTRRSPAGGDKASPGQDATPDKKAEAPAPSTTTEARR